MYYFEIIQKNNYLNLLIIIMKNIIHFLKWGLGIGDWGLGIGDWEIGRAHV